MPFLTWPSGPPFSFPKPPIVTDSSGYVARESVRVANLTVPDQAFGIEPDSSAASWSIGPPELLV